MSEANKGEAKPQNNTERVQNINPITFDEAALARLLDGAAGNQSVEENPKPVPDVQEQATEDVVQNPAQADSDVSEASAEDEALSNSETEEATTEDESEKGEEPEESLGVQKRIDKLVARAKAAEEEIQRLKSAKEESEAKLQDQAQNRAPDPIDTSNPLAAVWDYRALETKKDEMIELRRWCESNPEGYVAKNGQEYSAEQIRQAKYNAEDYLEKFIPRRAQFLLEYSQVKPVAENLYPFWKDRASQAHAEANEILRLVPQLKSHPTYQVFIGDYLAGRDLRLKTHSEKAKQVKAPITKAPKQPSAPKTAPVKADGKQVRANSQRSAFLKTGKESELASLIQNFI